MKQSFDYIAAIFNPNSTNNAASKAAAFRDRAKKAGLKVHLYETTHAGHAREIAAHLAEKYKRPLIISVSGDGGYNEVINGIMDAKDKSAREPVVAIVAAGNANDHKRLTRGDTPLLTLIKKNQPKPLDLIRVKSKGIDRYAHSYAGLGITPEVGIELNKHSLSFVKEVGIVLKTFRNFTPFEIIVEGKRRKMGSLVFANVQGMAKVIKLTSKSTLQDGKFDIIRLSYPNKFRFLLSLLLMTLRPHPSRSMSSFTFTTTSKLPIQLDGEIEKLAARSEVEVTSVKSAVMSLY